MVHLLQADLAQAVQAEVRDSTKAIAVSAKEAVVAAKDMKPSTLLIRNDAMLLMWCVSPRLVLGFQFHVALKP